MQPTLKWDPALTQHGVELRTYTPAPNERYWRLVSGEYLGDKDHNIFVEMLDENGRRVQAGQVRFWWGQGGAGEQEIKRTESKPDQNWTVDFPMYAGGASYGVQPLGLPGDTVWGLGLGTPEHPQGKEHVSWRLVFQAATAAQVEQPGGGAVVDEEMAAFAQRLRGMAVDLNHMAAAIDGAGLARG